MFLIICTLQVKNVDSKNKINFGKKITLDWVSAQSEDIIAL